jgi:hypothetical protein
MKTSFRRQAVSDSFQSTEGSSRPIRRSRSQCLFGMALALGVCLVSDLGAVVISNGSLESTNIGTNRIPSGWSILNGTPDTFDASSSFSYVGTTETYTASPDGGSFARVGSTFPGDEVFGQDVTGLTIGVPIVISFYHGNPTYSSGQQPSNVEVRWDGNLVYTAPTVTAAGWYLREFTVTPTATTQQLSFTPGFFSASDVALIDGVVPEPSSLSLLGLTFVGVCVSRRRRQ